MKKIHGGNATTGTGQFSGKGGSKPKLDNKGNGTANAGVFKGSKGTKR